MTCAETTRSHGGLRGASSGTIPRVVDGKGSRSMGDALRFVIYSQDGMGLGHLRRNTLIGQRVLEAAPGRNILLIADSPVAPFFSLPSGMDFLKLPSIQKIGPGQWQPTHLRTSWQDVALLRAALLGSAFQCYKPDLLLVDHMPVGARGELTTALGVLKRARPNCAVVLG